MGTSGRRTPPGPRLAGPRGHPDRLSRQSKNEQIAFWFQVPSATPWLESHCHIGQVDRLPPIGVIPILQTFLMKSGSGVRSWLA
jgi:hypothetical protein